jgi:hypothetical protein
MTVRDIIRNTIETCDGLLQAYLGDLTDKELLTRPNPQSHHVAWQLGHMIVSENQMLEAAGFAMPALPAGFAEAYTPETAKSDDPAKFHKKEQYLGFLAMQRSATLAHLGKLKETDFDKPTPESMHSYAPTLGAMFNIIGIHAAMHAAQFVPTRRKLGKPIVI